MRRLRTATAVLALAGVGLIGTAGAAEAATGPVNGTKAATACPTGWGSTTKSAQDTHAQPLKNITTSHHTCYDRMVFDVGGGNARTGYHVGYVDAFHQDGSGERIPVRGGAILQIHANTPSYDPASGRPSYGGKAGQPLPGVDIAGYRTFQDTRFGASFEGQTQVGLGVRARLPFRVLQSGSRLIVDVAHAW